MSEQTADYDARNGCARCGHAVPHTPGCIDLTCSCDTPIPPEAPDQSP